MPVDEWASSAEPGVLVGGAQRQGLAQEEQPPCPALNPRLRAAVARTTDPCGRGTVAARLSPPNLNNVPEPSSLLTMLRMPHSNPALPRLESTLWKQKSDATQS